MGIEKFTCGGSFSRTRGKIVGTTFFQKFMSPPATLDFTLKTYIGGVVRSRSLGAEIPPRTRGARGPCGRGLRPI